MPESLRLNKDSKDKEIQQAISMCIRQYRRDGYEPDKAAAICYDKARKETGKEMKQ